MCKCLYCSEQIDVSIEPYVKPRSNRYAHVNCAKEQGLNLQVIDPNNYETCTYCKQQIDKTKDSYKELTKNKFSHLSCWESNKDKLSDKEKLEMYICHLYKINKLNPKMNRQIKEYIENYNYTYSGIQKTLTYYYEVKGNPFNIDKTGGGIGIVPYYYDISKRYYFAIWEAKQNQEKQLNISGIEKYIPKIKEITIPPPKIKPWKKSFFRFLDEEEENN